MPVSPSIERPPSLRDLARELNVSHTTVAMALKNDTRISFEVRRRVQSAARKRGYLGNDIPRNLFTKRSHFVGLSLPDLCDPFYARIFEGAQGPLWEANKMPLTLSHHEDGDREEMVLERCGRLRSEGVLLVPSAMKTPRAHFAETLRKSTVLVTMERPLPQLALPCVRSDEAMGILRATLHLLETGHRHPVFCSSSLDEPEAVQRRLQGFHQVVERAGLNRHVIQVTGGSRRNRLAELEKLLAPSDRERPDALVAASDATAAALIMLLGELGVRVPGDISVTGFGGRRFFGAENYHGPSLTTVDSMPEKIGQEAALVLLNLLENGGQAPEEILIEPELVEGATTSLRTSG